MLVRNLLGDDGDEILRGKDLEFLLVAPGCRGGWRSSTLPHVSDHLTSSSHTETTMMPGQKFLDEFLGYLAVSLQQS